MKRWEKSITTPTPASEIYTAEQVIHDDAMRARLADVFIFDRSRVSDEESSGSPREGEHRPPENVGREEEHIRRDLRSLGLI